MHHYFWTNKFWDVKTSRCKFQAKFQIFLKIGWYHWTSFLTIFLHSFSKCCLTLSRFSCEVLISLFVKRLRDTMSTEYKWKTIPQNYEDFQNELDNSANGVHCLHELFVEFHKYEVEKLWDFSTLIYYETIEKLLFSVDCKQSFAFIYRQHWTKIKFQCIPENTCEFWFSNTSLSQFYVIIHSICSGWLFQLRQTYVTKVGHVT